MPRQPTKQAEQTAPDLIIADCLAGRVRLLSRTITAIHDDALRPLGLTAGQLNVLVFVAKLAPVAPKDLARRLNMEKSTVSRNVTRMADQGWLSVTEAESGRGQVLQLSAKGRRLVEKSVPLWSQAQECTTAMLGEKGAQALHRTANTLWARLART